MIENETLNLWKEEQYKLASRYQIDYSLLINNF